MRLSGLKASSMFFLGALLSFESLKKSDDSAGAVSVGPELRSRLGEAPVVGVKVLAAGLNSNAFATGLNFVGLNGPVSEVAETGPGAGGMRRSAGKGAGGGGKPGRPYARFGSGPPPTWRGDCSGPE